MTPGTYLCFSPVPCKTQSVPALIQREQGRLRSHLICIRTVSFCSPDYRMSTGSHLATTASLTATGLVSFDSRCISVQVYSRCLDRLSYLRHCAFHASQLGGPAGHELTAECGTIATATSVMSAKYGLCGPRQLGYHARRTLRRCEHPSVSANRYVVFVYGLPLYPTFMGG